MSLVKICTYCNTEKTIEEYYSQKRGKYGVTSVCKSCTKIKDEERNTKEKIIPIGGIKTCSGCGFTKELKDFSKTKHKTTGYNSRCKVCTKQDAQLIKNKEKQLVSHKVCRKCNIVKPTSEFFKASIQKDGFDSQCKDCNKVYVITLIESKDKIIPYDNLKECPKCKETKTLENFNKNKGTKTGHNCYCKICDLTYRENNKEIIALSNKKWREENKDYLREKKREEYNNTWKHDKEYMLVNNIKGLIRKSIKSTSKGKVIKSKRTEEILQCTIQEFKKHIESQFLNWMTWENHGNICSELNYNCSWDLDHIIPITKARNEEELYLLNHWSNFQPLCSKINRDIKRNIMPLLTNLELNIASSTYFSK